MKTVTKSAGFALALVAVASLSLIGCAQFQSAGAKVQSWWNNPKTQAGVQIAEQAVVSSALHFGIDVAQQEINGGKVDLKGDGVDSGLFALRTLEMTPQASNAAAIVSTVVQAIKDPTTASAVAASVVNAVSAATKQGADPSGALEGAVRGIEQAKTSAGKP